MRARTLKELYNIVLASLENENNYYEYGLCNVFYELDNDCIISQVEWHKLQKHLDKRKPTARNKFKSFFKDKLFDKNGDYWWRCMSHGIEYRKVRIEFIKALIKTL